MPRSPLAASPPPPNFCRPQQHRALIAGAGVLPGAGQGLDLANDEDDEGGGVGQLFLHIVKEPLHQFAALPKPLQMNTDRCRNKFSTFEQRLWLFTSTKMPCLKVPGSPVSWIATCIIVLTMTPV